MSCTYKKVLHKIIKVNTHIKFDDEGRPHCRKIFTAQIWKRTRGWTTHCDSTFHLVFVKHISKYVEVTNNTSGLVVRSDPNPVAQTIKQSCVLFCLKSTYKKVGQDELHHTQEDQSEHINKFDEGNPLHEGMLYPDLLSIAHSCYYNHVMVLTF